MPKKDKPSEEEQAQADLRDALRKERDGRAKQSKLDEKDAEWKEWGK